MAQVWSKTQVKMESESGAVVTLTAISKASPAVATYSGSDALTDGQIVLLDIKGMFQIDKMPVRVANVNATNNTFELEGVDSRTFDDFISGTATVKVLGTSITTMADISVSGGEFEEIDTTTIHDETKQSQPGAASPIIVSGNVNWDPADAGQQAMKAASQAKAQRVFEIVFANGYRWITNGYVGFVGAPGGSAQQKVSSPYKITCKGNPSMYAN